MLEVPIPDHVRIKIQTISRSIKESSGKVMICPAGGLAISILKSLQEMGIEVTGLLDNSPAKQGTTIAGLPIMPLASLEYNTPNFVMIATLSFRDQIMGQLKPYAARLGFSLVDPCEMPESAAVLPRSVSERLDKLYAIECRNHIEQILSRPEYEDPLRLDRFGYRCYSQHDEDGIIQEIIRRLDDMPRTFVEFGVGDGLENNTLLLLKQGWNGLWIDGSQANAAAIRSRFADQIEAKQLVFLERMITRENINALIGARFAGEIGLLSVDIDGNDYYVWEAIDAVNPQIVVIEYNAKYPPPIKWSIAYNPEHMWDFSDYMGASLAALTELGTRKKYQLVGCNINGTNAFFVREDLLQARFYISRDPMVYYHPPRYYLMEGFQLMSGHRPDPRPGVFF